MDLVTDTNEMALQLNKENQIMTPSEKTMFHGIFLIKKKKLVYLVSI